MIRMAAALTLLLAALAAGQVTAIENARVVDGLGGAARAATVVIRGERIEAVLEAGAKPPAGAKIIDAAGHTLIPGLFDLHTHMPYSGLAGINGDWGKNLKAYLLHGVTSAVDFGTYPETFAPMRRLLRAGMPGPRMHLAARMTTPGGHGAEAGRGDFFSLEVTTPAEARAAVARLLPYAPDVIKVFTDGWRYGAGADMTSMDQATLAEIVKQAHAHDIEVMTHTVTLERAKDAARAGVDVIAHGVGDARVDAGLLQLLKARRTSYVSTMAVFETKTWPTPRSLYEYFLEPAAMQIFNRMSSPSSPPTAARRSRWENLEYNLQAIFQAGGRVGAGTDAGVTGTLHGRSSVRELELMVAAGLKPVEAIRAATLSSAQAIHVDRDRGSIEAGKLADLVMIHGAPHERIADLYQVAGVWLGGQALDVATLRRQIASDAMTPMTARPAKALIDDMELPERTTLGTLRVNASDPGHDNSKAMFQRVARSVGNHGLAIQAHMGEKEKPFVQIWLPLSEGAIEPVDASRFHGIRFEARGEGAYKILLQPRSIRGPRDPLPEAGFTAGPSWKPVTISFATMKAASVRDLLVVAFEIARPPGARGWLELDNVRFY